MNLALLTPWQQLFWIVCLVALVVPIISWGVIGIVRGYFKAKEEHYGRIAGAVASAVSKSSEEIMKKAQEAKEKLDISKKKEE